MTSLDEYTLWNYMLAEQCLLADSYQGAVLLTVTPRVLVAALEQAGEPPRPMGEAEADFVAAVSSVYHTAVLGSSARLNALKSEHDVPLATGFLALSVLAAYNMRTDDEHTGRAYYPRLAEMLGCELVRTYPAGFDGGTFVELWRELAEWLDKEYGRRLALPEGVGVRRYMSYPLAHVPLRQVDIERLPQFFDSYGYEPGTRAPLDRLAFDLYERAGPWGQLTNAGQRALADPGRRPFVVRQVAHELERWDGYRTEPSGTQVGRVEIWMDIRRRRAQLSLLARRPSGFPELFEDGEFVFESSQDGWYDPMPLGPGDGPLLDHGMRAEAALPAGRYVLELASSQVIPLTPSEQYSGFVSDRALRMGAECGVLCSDSVSSDVGEFLSEVCQARVRPRRDDTLPKGWSLFAGVRPAIAVEPPLHLGRLRLESSVTLVPEGGLRLGRRWTWLEGAPARLTIVGERGSMPVMINGKEVEVGPGGSLPVDMLRSAGVHHVEIGNQLRQRINVLSGAVHPDCRGWLPVRESGRFTTAVPAGFWTVFGSVVGQRKRVVAPSGGGIVETAFCPRWAVRVGSGPGAIALHIHDPNACRKSKTSATPLPTTQTSKDDRLALEWAEPIYQAAVRRPRLLCPWGCKAEQLRANWRSLAHEARAAKRQLKRRRG